MTYNYYCTFCGREMNQDNVLFDMQPILTGSETNRFHILSFRMTKAELEALIASGTPEDMGYSRCQFTLQGLLSYISNKNNLDNEDIQSLTLEDIKAYTTIEKNAEAPQTAFNPIDNLFATEEQQGEPKLSAEEAPKATCKAIDALERASQKNEDITFTQNDLRAELQILYGIGETYSFAIKGNWEKDNDGNKILIGYTVKTGIPEHATIVNRRVCPYCGENVFEHAGTAEHRAVTFIGDQKAGKTSTILALAHYAQKAATGAMPSDEIWGGSKKIPSVATIELVSPCERLLKDLENYEKGIAPAKTSALKRLDAYSATFRIKNYEQDRHYLLTLTDLPGELCGEPTPQDIDVNRILNEFHIALTGDVFVLCFDSSTAVDGKELTMVHNACSWADKFQQLRDSQTTRTASGKTKDGLYVPVMLIFNKCPDLEIPEQAPSVRPATQFDSILQTYVFDMERQLIDGKEESVYKKIGDQISLYGTLNNAYHARLRVSPFGFAAPNKQRIAEDPSLNTDEEGKIRYPKPKHVAELMNWLLEATGCIPVNARYYPDPSDKDRYCEKPGNFSEKTQYRGLLPSGKGKDGDIREALLRCHLFENPNSTDISILESYDQRAVLLGERIKAFYRNRMKKSR